VRRWKRNGRRNKERLGFKSSRISKSDSRTIRLSANAKAKRSTESWILINRYRPNSMIQFNANKFFERFQFSNIILLVTRSVDELKAVKFCRNVLKISFFIVYFFFLLGFDVGPCAIRGNTLNTIRIVLFYAVNLLLSPYVHYRSVQGSRKDAFNIHVNAFPEFRGKRTGILWLLLF